MNHQAAAAPPRGKALAAGTIEGSMPETDLARDGALLYSMPSDLGPTTDVRGTIVALDQRWVQSASLFDAYAASLGLRHPLLHVASSDWLPFPAAMEHWAALDALGVSNSVAVQAGRYIGETIHGSLLRTLVTLAGKLGFTPWTALANCHKFWRRNWRGGAVVVRRRGPTSVTLELVDAPVARSKFFRASLGGTIAVGLEPFCRRVVVSESEEKPRGDNVVLRISWQ